MSGVRDILQDRELFHVEENDTVASVVRRMAEIRVGAILVLEGEQLRGVFSERDLMKRVVLERLDPELTPVKDVMSTDIATIDETASLEEAMEAMHAHNCRHLPVTRGVARGGVPFHAGPHAPRTGAQDRGTAPHAGIYSRQHVSLKGT